MRLLFTTRASGELDAIRAYIARDDARAAVRTVTRIRQAIEPLKAFPYLGRTGSDPETRELNVGGLPYIVVYEIDEEARTVLVLNVAHGARQR